MAVWTKSALALAAALTLFPGSASAATHTFKVLSASETYTTTATEGCVSGTRKVTESTTAAVPEDPANSFTPGSGREGNISTRSSTTGTSPTAGTVSNDHTESLCEPPCHHDYGTTTLTGGSIAMTLFDTGDPETVKVAADFGPPEVGDV